MATRSWESSIVSLVTLTALLTAGCSPDYRIPAKFSVLWEESFDSNVDYKKAEFNANWTLIFGDFNFSTEHGALHGDPGEEDKNDDYGYRASNQREFLITQDWYWDIEDAVGAENVVDASGALYEASLYRGRLQLFRYDGGGDPSVYEILASSRKLNLESGFYRLLFYCRYTNRGWELTAKVQDPSRNFKTIATISAPRDNHHGESIGQGVGIYNRTNGNSYLIYMKVELPVAQQNN